MQLLFVCQETNNRNRQIERGSVGHGAAGAELAASAGVNLRGYNKEPESSDHEALSKSALFNILPRGPVARIIAGL